MISAYLYLCTADNKQKDYEYPSPQQIRNLLKYCKQNNIHVSEIFRESLSAITDDQPKWKKLLFAIKKGGLQVETVLLFTSTNQSLVFDNEIITGQKRKLDNQAITKETDNMESEIDGKTYKIKISLVETSAEEAVKKLAILERIVKNRTIL